MFALLPKLLRTYRSSSCASHKNSRHVQLLLFLNYNPIQRRHTTVTIVTPQMMPVLLPCDRKCGDGFVSEFGGPRRAVRIVLHDALSGFIDDGRKFRSQVRAKGLELTMLRALILLWRSFRTGANTKVSDLAHEIVRLLWPDADEEDQAHQWDLIRRDPSEFVQKYLGAEAKDATLVLWQPNKKDNLAVGVLCESEQEALYTLAVFEIGFGSAIRAAFCTVCGNMLRRRRGDRRTTCSDKCRKKKSRLQRKGDSTRRMATPRTDAVQ